MTLTPLRDLVVRNGSVNHGAVDIATRLKNQIFLPDFRPGQGDYILTKVKTLPATRLTPEHERGGLPQTYEEIFARKFVEAAHNVVLIGDTGSGKSHKLDYVLTKMSCGCRSKQSLRLDVDRRRLEKRGELFADLTTHIAGFLSSDSSWYDQYKDFVSGLFRHAGQPSAPHYLYGLVEVGLTEPTPPGLLELKQACKKKPQMRDLALFGVDFLGHLRNARSICNKCAHLIVDNIDGSSRAVQDDIVDLLTHTPTSDLLIVTACRPETFINWRAKAQVLDLVRHVGPTGHQVVVHRLKAFIAGDPELDGDLTRKLGVIEKWLNKPFFSKLFERLFGSQIREALLFAQGLVDLAVFRTIQELEEAEAKSDQAIQRLFFRPWGVSGTVSKLPNVFDMGGAYEDRLTCLRVLRMLSREGDCSIRGIWRRIRACGGDRDTFMNVLGEMLRAGLILTTSRDGIAMSKYGACKSEQVKLRSLGKGIIKLSSDLEYLSTVMLGTLCEDTRYESVQIKDEGVVPVLCCVRVFLQETWGLESVGIEKAVEKAKVRDDLLNDFRSESITENLLTGVIQSSFRIGKAVEGRLGDQSREIYEQVLYLVSDYWGVLNARTEHDESFEASPSSVEIEKIKAEVGRSLMASRRRNI